MGKELTPKQKRFAHKIVENRANGEPDYKAAEEVFDIQSKNKLDVSSSIATEYLKKPEIQAYIQQLAREEGLTYKVVIQGILAGMSAQKQVAIAGGLIAKLLKKAGMVEPPKATELDDDWIELPDYPTRLGYLKLAAELLDMFPDKKVEVEGLVGHVWIEQLKKELGIDEQGLLTVREMDMDDIPEEALPLPDSDNKENPPGATDWTQDRCRARNTNRNLTPGW